MAVYGIGDNKCKVETMSREEINNALSEISSSIDSIETRITNEINMLDSTLRAEIISLSKRVSELEG